LKATCERCCDLLDPRGIGDAELIVETFRCRGAIQERERFAQAQLPVGDVVLMDDPVWVDAAVLEGLSP
jgi:hypothetical protein